MDAGLQQCVRAGSEMAVGHAVGAGEVGAGAKVVAMHSGALHDAAPLAAVMPSAMLFVPSIKGISHNYDEHTREEDIAAGARAFVAAAAAALLGQCDEHVQEEKAEL